MFALNPIRLARRVDRCFSSAGVIVRGSDRLRFWRTPLSEKNRQDDDTADGHELHGADGLTPMSRLLRAVVARTPQGVQRERQNEQERQRDPQRALVQPELPPSTSYR